MELSKYLAPQLLTGAIALYLIGAALKKAPKLPNWVIPFALGAAGILGACSILGWTPDSVIQGVIMAGVSVYGNQLYKQITTKENTPDADIDYDGEIQGGADDGNTGND